LLKGQVLPEETPELAAYLEEWSEEEFYAALSLVLNACQITIWKRYLRVPLSFPGAVLVSIAGQEQLRDLAEKAGPLAFLLMGGV